MRLCVPFAAWVLFPLCVRMDSVDICACVCVPCVYMYGGCVPWRVNVCACLYGDLGHTHLCLALICVSVGSGCYPGVSVCTRGKCALVCAAPSLSMCTPVSVYVWGWGFWGMWVHVSAVCSLGDGLVHLSAKHVACVGSSVCATVCICACAVFPKPKCTHVPWACCVCATGPAMACQGDPSQLLCASCARWGPVTR